MCIHWLHLVSIKPLIKAVIGDTGQHFGQTIGLSPLLASYQQTVEKILGLRSFTGVTLQELERFKQEFKTTAFTCRMVSCPYSTVGFQSSQLRSDHEASHFGILCQVPGCPYPPFSSKKNLDRHRLQCHEDVQKITRKTIRRSQGSMPANRLTSSMPELRKGGIVLLPEANFQVSKENEATYFSKETKGVSSEFSVAATSLVGIDKNTQVPRSEQSIISGPTNVVKESPLMTTNTAQTAPERYSRSPMMCRQAATVS